eukprot:gene19895-biopygen8513
MQNGAARAGGGNPETAPKAPGNGKPDSERRRRRRTGRYVQNIGQSRRHRRRPAPEARPDPVLQNRPARARDVLFPTQTAPGNVGKCAKPRVNIEIGAAGAGKMRNTIWNTRK